MRKVLGLVALVALGGCDYDAALETVINTHFTNQWTNATSKAALEDRAERNLLPRLRERLNGVSMLRQDYGLGTYEVYVHDVDWVAVDLGGTPPRIDVRNATVWSTELFDYVRFDWEFSWARGNRAEIRFRMDMRPWFPDYTIRIYDIHGRARGWAQAAYPKRQGFTGWATAWCGEIDVTARTAAEFWYFTADGAQVTRSVADSFVFDAAESQIRKALGF